MCDSLVCDEYSDEMGGDDVELDEAVLAEMRAASATAAGPVPCCSALEGAIVLRIAQKQLLDSCLQALAAKDSKRKR